MVSIWCIMVLSLERFLVIYHVSRYKQANISMWNIKMVMTSIWVLAVILATLPLMGVSRYVYEVRLYFLPFIDLKI